MSFLLFIVKTLGLLLLISSLTLGTFVTIRARRTRRDLSDRVVEQRQNLADISRRYQEELKRVLDERNRLKSEGRTDEAQALRPDTDDVEEERRLALARLHELQKEEKKGGNVIRRLFVGDPTVGPISITQFSMWILIGFIGMVMFTARTNPYVGIVAFMFLLAFLRSGITTIENNPPHRGVLTRFGKRTEVEIDEGLVFLCPIVEDVIPVNVRKRDYDVKILDVRSKDDSPLDVKVSLAYIPDPDRLKRFLQVGNENIVSLIDSLVQQEIRIFLYDKTDWQIAERKTLDGKERYLQQPYQSALGLRRGLVDLLFNSITEASNGRSDLDPEVGLADTQGWGVRFLNIYIGPIHLGGKLADAAEKRAIENAEREAEVFEKETDSLAASKLIEMAKKLHEVDLSYDQALQLVLDYKATNAGHGFALPSVSVKMVADILSRLVGGR